MIEVSGMKNIAIAAPWITVGIISAEASTSTVKRERMKNTIAKMMKAVVAKPARIDLRQQLADHRRQDDREYADRRHHLAGFGRGVAKVVSATTAAIRPGCRKTSRSPPKSPPRRH